MFDPPSWANGGWLVGGNRGRVARVSGLGVVVPYSGTVATRWNSTTGAVYATVCLRLGRRCGGVASVGVGSASAESSVVNGPIAVAGDQTGRFEIYRMRQNGTHADG